MTVIVAENLRLIIVRERHTHTLKFVQRITARGH